VTRLRITLSHSLIGHPRNQKETARALGLRRREQSIVRPDNPAIRGMIETIDHLLTVEEIEENEG